VFYVPDDAKYCKDFLERVKSYSKTEEALIQYYDKPPTISEFDDCEDSLMASNY
jgi:hypothetical protein